MTTAVDAGPAKGPPVTGVVRLIETGMEVGGVVPSACLPTTPVPKTMMTVPVQVPSVKLLGSAEIVKLIPSGGMIPLPGVTANHGLSTVATNEVIWPGRPLTWIGKVTGCVLPEGTGMLGLIAPSAGSGMTITDAMPENGPMVWLQLPTTRTR